MEWLILIHVLSAVLGLGPTYAFPLLLRKATTASELAANVGHVTRLELFPKTFGTVAVLSGIALFALGSYGPFLQVWIVGTLAVYAAIEVLVIGFLNPATKRLLSAIDAIESNDATAAISADMESIYARVRTLHLWASLLAIVIFVLMIWKPA